MFHFASKEQLETWSSSQERAYWIHKIDQVIEKPTKLASLTGLETWFVLSKFNRFSPPPKHKMVVVVYLAISLTLTVFGFFFGDYFASIPIPLKFWTTSPFIVAIMTYLVMPIMTKAFKKISILFKLILIQKTMCFMAATLLVTWLNNSMQLTTNGPSYGPITSTNPSALGS